MEESLVAYLLAHAGLSALIASRITWIKIQQNAAKPFVVLMRVSGLRDVHMTGVSGLIESRVQIDCYGLTYASAKGVARQAEARLSGYAGTQGTTKFEGCFMIAERDGYDDDATPDKLFRTSLDFTIWHKGI